MNNSFANPFSIFFINTSRNDLPAKPEATLVKDVRGFKKKIKNFFYSYQYGRLYRNCHLELNDHLLADIGFKDINKDYSLSKSLTNVETAFIGK